ncbi:DNA-binding XRE family transcriptional regulator [Hydrogenoanaerobacterium saccharovorans]|uniref:DNA-binding transcriptional regulator, XRE-family HTH domain n=1 Tax=Hydrogenoanaerobacterium saccharovorans TaxID=474960 RepID=A0A1H8BF83_9FIRM|nr:helix-turn-helix transcriptional regulator [Hydrogenoanaerobacterium saccharovorans]RPF47440.1 DNA-binding XRE family transcriptional regulator [Hydrogenoanaerobacterium saccharovorans]SEM81483.1 DNA-binding transcriptional regulator, XRE-family HTH domain [Hydrogenoanaerobacterium saccharovorans]
MKTYIEIIRELREDNDLKQEAIAKILGTSQQMYSRYEKGLNEMPIRHLIMLCKFYNVSADYILGLKQDKN